MKSLCCPNKACPHTHKAGAGNIIRHGFYKTNWGRRRRYRCRICGATFCSNVGTPYYRLQHRRTTFDEVAALSVEGLNKSAIARVKRIGWNTVARWLEKAADSTIAKQPDSPLQSCKPTRFAQLLAERISRSGSLPWSRSGLGFGPRQLLGDEATGTHCPSFETFPTE